MRPLCTRQRSARLTAGACGHTVSDLLVKGHAPGHLLVLDLFAEVQDGCAHAALGNDAATFTLRKVRTGVCARLRLLRGWPAGG